MKEEKKCNNSQIESNSNSKSNASNDNNNNNDDDNDNSLIKSIPDSEKKWWLHL